MNQRIPLPGDFAAIAVGRTNEQLAAHYGTGLTIISRWRRATGTQAKLKQLPEDFASVAPTMSYAEMEDLYGVASDTIQRWCKECGVTSRGRPGKGLPKPVTTPKAKKFFNWGRPAATLATPDGTEAGRAAHFLRRIYPNVYRASILDKDTRRAHGIPGDGADHFHVGARGIVPVGEMIELARSKGWAA